MPREGSCSKAAGGKVQMLNLVLGVGVFSLHPNKSRSLYAMNVGSCTIFSVKVPCFQGICTPYDPSLYGIRNCFHVDVSKICSGPLNQIATQVLARREVFQWVRAPKVETFRRSRTPSEPSPLTWFGPDFDLMFRFSSESGQNQGSKSGPNQARGEGFGGGLVQRVGPAGGAL